MMRATRHDSATARENPAPWIGRHLPTFRDRSFVGRGISASETIAGHLPGLRPRFELELSPFCATQQLVDGAIASGLVDAIGFCTGSEKCSH